MPNWIIIVIFCSFAIVSVILYVVCSKVSFKKNKGLSTSLKEYLVKNNFKWLYMWNGSFIISSNSLIEFDGIIITNFAIIIINQIDVGKEKINDQTEWNKAFKDNLLISEAITGIISDYSIPIFNLAYYKKEYVSWNNKEKEQINEYSDICEIIWKHNEDSKIVIDKNQRNLFFNKLNDEVDKSISLQIRINNFEKLKKRKLKLKK